MDVQTLRADRAAAYAVVESIGITGDPDKLESAMNAVDNLDRQITQAVRMQALRGDTAISGPAFSQPTDFMAGFSPERVALLTAHNNLPMPQREQLRGYAGDVPFRGLGAQLQAVHAAANGFSRDPRLVGAALGQNETIASDGGFIVQVDQSNELLRRTWDKSMLASKARKFPLGANSNGMKINALKDNSRATGSRYGGVRGYWVAEAGLITASGPIQFRQIELNLKKLAGIIYATDEILQDSSFFEALVRESFSDEFAFMVDEAILTGNGTGKPLGFMNAGGKITVAKETGQAARTIVYENIQKMWSRMYGRSMANAVWYINQDTYPSLNAMSMVIGTGGVPVYLPPGGLSVAPYGTLMGRPVQPIEFAETLGTEGDIILADLSQYMIIDKSMDFASSIHVAFLTGEQAFRFQYRVDGQPIDITPITPYKGTATQSAFVTLATRA